MDENLKKKFDRLQGELGKTAAQNADHAEKAGSVAGFAAAAAFEAARASRAPKQLAAAVSGLRAAGAEFEASHPALTALVDEICRELAELGI